MQIPDKILRTVKNEIPRIRNLIRDQNPNVGEVLRSGVFPFIWVHPFILYNDSYEVYVKLLEILGDALKPIPIEYLDHKLINLILNNLKTPAAELQGVIDQFFTDFKGLTPVEWTIYVPLDARIMVDAQIGQAHIRPASGKVWEFIMEQSSDEKVKKVHKIDYDAVKEYPRLEVKVNALTPEHALILAKKKIRDYLNFITLARGIEKIRILDFYFAIKDTQNYYWTHETPEGPKFQISTPEEGQNFEKVMQSYDYLLPLIEESTTMTEFEKKVKQAITWFGRGRDELDKIFKFINYAVAAEILTVGTREVDSISKVDSITYHFKRAIGAAVRHSKYSRKEIEQQASKLYDIRSNIVHEGLTEVSPDDLYRMESIALVLIMFFGRNRIKFRKLDDLHGLIALRDFLAFILVAFRKLQNDSR